MKIKSREVEILALHAVGLVPHRTCLIHGIRGGFAGDQARAGAEREIFESPLNEHENAALKLHDIDQVDEEPHQPSWQSGNVDTKNICHRSRAANHGHLALIKIMKWSQLFLPLQTCTDNFGRVRPALHGDLRDTGKRLSRAINSVSKIANDEYIREVGNGQVAIHLDTAAAIRFRAGALGEFPAEWRGHDASGPEHGLGRKRFMRLSALERDTTGVDVRHHNALDHFHAEAR